MTSTPLDALPAAFDLQLYRTSNPDLAMLGDDAVRAHYEMFGRDEGRVSSCVRSRHEFVNLISTDALVLEIGPFCIPTVKEPPFHVRYLDVFSTEQLRERAAAMEWADPDLVPRIDYVWSGKPYRSIIETDFDYVYSAHCVEHQPCLVRHLRDVASVLKSGGAYFATIPDKRYCFDYYRPLSSIADVLDAFEATPNRHSLRTVVEHNVLAIQTHNDALRHWKGDHGIEPLTLDDVSLERLRGVLDVARKGQYVDAHAWKFTPQSFANVIHDLENLGLIDFHLTRVYPTVLNTNEFHVVLVRT